MRLLRVELTRFRSRRAVALMLIVAAVLTAVVAGATIWETRPVSAQDLARAEAQLQRELDRPYVQREIDRCERNPRRYLGPGAAVKDCERVVAPQLEWFLFRSTLSLAQERADSGFTVLLIVAAVMIVIGITFAGADWASGSMSNQVLFEPRRIKVWLAKCAAAFLGTLVAAAVIMAAFWLALHLTAEMRGISTGAQIQEDIGWTTGRGVLLAAFGGLGGFALTMLVRHTVGAMAVMFVYAAGGEAIIGTLPAEGVGRWSLANNVLAWLRDGWRYYDPSIACPPARRFCTQQATLTIVEGATYLVVLLLVVVVFSIVSFRRRDIP